MSSNKKRKMAPLVGKPALSAIELSNAELVLFRIPSDVDPSTLHGMKLDAMLSGTAGRLKVCAGDPLEAAQMRLAVLRESDDRSSNDEENDDDEVEHTASNVEFVPRRITRVLHVDAATVDASVAIASGVIAPLSLVPRVPVAPAPPTRYGVHLPTGAGSRGPKAPPTSKKRKEKSISKRVA